MFGLSQKVKLFSVQPKLSSRGLSYLCRVQSTGISLSLWLSLGWAKSSDWAVAETKQKIRLQFLAHLRLISGSGLCSVLRPHQHSIGYMEEGFLGSAKRLSHGLSQKVKSPIAEQLQFTHSVLPHVQEIAISEAKVLNDEPAVKPSLVSQLVCSQTASVHWLMHCLQLANICLALVHCYIWFIEVTGCNIWSDLYD